MSFFNRQNLNLNFSLLTFLFSALAIAFVINSWIMTSGVPYHSDANESFSAYVQGQNILNFDFKLNYLLPDDAPGKHISAHPFTYTHGPNLPRYFSYLMSLSGIKSIEYQILFTSLFSLILSIWFIYKSFPDIVYTTPSNNVLPLSIIIIGLFCLDFLGTLQFIVNLWRTWHFPLFWGCIWAIRTRPNIGYVFSLFFLLFQLEYLFAIFTFCSCIGYHILRNHNSRKELFSSTGLTMIAASITSVVVFIAQLIGFYGLTGFLFDLKTTYIARNTNTIEWDSIRHFYEINSVMMWPSTPSWDFRYTVFLKVTFENLVSKLSLALACLCLVSLILSLAMLIQAKYYKRNKIHVTNFKLNNSVAPLLFSIVLTYLILGLVIPGYTLNGYVHRWAPMLVFPVILALALLAANLFIILSSSLKKYNILNNYRFTLLPVISTSLIGLWLLSSLEHYKIYPHFMHKPALALATTYKGHSFVSGTTFPHMISHYTGKWAYYSPLIFPGNAHLDQTNNWNADRYKNLDYTTPEYYLCETLPYNGYMDCTDVANEMVKNGHTIVEKKDGYYILKLNWALDNNKISKE